MIIVWAILFIVLALIAGVLGFARLSAASATIAKLLFFIFLLAAILLTIQWAIGGFATE